MGTKHKTKDMETDLFQGVSREIYELWANANQQRTQRLIGLGLSVGAANALARKTNPQGIQWNDLATLRNTPLEVIQVSVRRIGPGRIQEIADLLARTEQGRLGVQLPLPAPSP